LSIATLAELAEIHQVVTHRGGSHAALKSFLRAYPNPTDAGVNLVFTLPRKQEISISLIDMVSGTRYPVYQGVKPKGTHSTYLNRPDVASGMYTVILSTDEGNLQQKLVFQ
jgi:hypothetical protein